MIRINEMSHKKNTQTKMKDFYFFSESITMNDISPQAFFKAGTDFLPNECFYWKNANGTLSLVGVGHAAILSSEDKEDRFLHISAKWKELCAALEKNESDAAPVLFGGFSFDPENERDAEWSEFPTAYFVVPTFQLTINDDQVTISINLISKQEDVTEELKQLRSKRDLLIQKTKREKIDVLPKPKVISVEERAKDLYMKAVADVTEQIKNGESDKVVIARSVMMNFAEDVQAITALQHISNEQQESYHFGLQKENQFFFGATPERLVEISNDRAYSACVAGSIRRGVSAEEDLALGQSLLRDHKNLEEHQYVVQMITNIFNRFCTDVSVASHPDLLEIRDIFHLFTPVEGKVSEGIDIFNLVEALHPTPALGGVPTDISMRIIREEEKMDRGYYAAPIGWANSDGDGEFAVAIRSALLDRKRAYLYAGGGIVTNSEVEKEYEETWVKFRPILRALGGNLDEE